jgi:hypothetical protein
MESAALGRLYDVGLGWAPVDLDTANGATGKRLDMSKFDAVTVLLSIGAAASGTDDLVLDLQQHTAYTGGTTADLDSAAVASSTGCTFWHIKSETLLDNDETWTKVTQSEASEITLTGATYAATQKIIAIEVRAAQLGDTYTHFSINAAITTSAVQLGTCLYLPHGLRYKRRGSKLGNLLNPPAANA